MHKAYHLKDDIQLLYIKRKGGRGLISIEECVEDAIAGFQQFVQTSQEKTHLCSMEIIKGTRNNRASKEKEPNQKDGKPKESKIGRIKDSMASSLEILTISLE